MLTNNGNIASNRDFYFDATSICDVTNSDVTDRTKNITSVFTEKQVEELLKDETRNVFLTFLRSYGPTMNGSSACIISDNVSEVFIALAQCPNLIIEKEDPSSLVWVVILMVGIICMFGNLVVIVTKTPVLLFKPNLSEEIKIYHFLVLNLSSSDLLMGIYLTAIAFDSRQKVIKNLYFSETNLCNALGALNFVSSQVTITILVVISGYRLYGVVRPYKKPSIKIAIILCAGIWILWLAASILPAFDLEPLSSIFTWGVVKDKTHDPGSYLFFHSEINIVATFTKLTDGKVNQYDSVSIRSYHSLLNILDVLSPASTNQKWMLLKPFQASFFCAINYVVTDQEFVSAALALLGIIMYDFFCCVFILIAYVKILSATKSYCNLCKHRGKINDVTSTHLTQTNNDKVGLLLRISIIIATNLFCWLPLCVSTFFLLPELRTFFTHCQNVSNSLKSLKIISIATLCLISSNSIINPYIYSMNYWVKIYRKCKTVIIK